MTAVPFAFSVHHLVTSVGDYAGFAAIVGLAVLILLYFAQARETSTLRRRLAELNEQLAELEPRLSQLVRQAARAAAPRPAPATISAARTTASGVAAPRRALAPAAPAGVGAPALADATRLIPTDPGPGVVGGNGAVHDDEREALGIGVGLADPGAPAAGGFVPAGPPPLTAAGVNGVRRLSGDPGSGARPVPAPPPSWTGPRRDYGGGHAVRRGGPPSGGSLLEERRSPWGRGALVLAAILVVAAIVTVALVLTNGSRSSTGAGNSSSASASSSHSHRRRPVKQVLIATDTVTVAELNGTTINGLAGDVRARLGAKGFKTTKAANAPNQAQATTSVGYQPGERLQAILVAQELGLKRSAVSPVSAQDLSAACPPSAGPCTANVVVTVGSDLAGLASASSSSAAGGSGTAGAAGAAGGSTSPAGTTT